MSYTVLAIFVNRGLFESYEGNVLVVGMVSVVPEMVVVIIYMVEGFILEKLPKDANKENCRRKKGGWRHARPNGWVIIRSFGQAQSRAGRISMMGVLEYLAFSDVSTVR